MLTVYFFLYGKAYLVSWLLFFDFRDYLVCTLTIMSISVLINAASERYMLIYNLLLFSQKKCLLQLKRQTSVSLLMELFFITTNFIFTLEFSICLHVALLIYHKPFQLMHISLNLILLFP